MTEPVRWGILGAARFARQHMGPAIHAARGGRLAAIATSDPAKAEPFADFAPGLRVFDDYEALLADPDIDAIYIPLPNHLHVEWSRRAAEAGKHVLCEKPIAMRADEIDALIALRDASGLLIAEAYMIVHHPQWQYARALYESGVVGDLQLVDGVFSYRNIDMNNIRNQADAGGGGIRDIGVYTYGSARYVTGTEPERIRAVTMDIENGVDTYAQVSAAFPGFHYSAVTSMRMMPRQEMNFHGDAGLIRLTTPFNASVFGEARVELHRPDLEIRVKRFPGVNHYVLQVENFNDSLRHGADYPCPLEFSRGTQRMIDMVFECHAAAAD